MSSIVLNPCMSYSVLKNEFENNLDLSYHLEISKDDLHKHYKENYTPSTPLSQPSQPSIPATSASPQKKFIARFNRKPRTSTDELLEFWSLPHREYHGFRNPPGSRVRVHGVRVRVGKFVPSQNPYPQQTGTGFRGFFPRVF